MCDRGRSAFGTPPSAERFTDHDGPTALVLAASSQCVHDVRARLRSHGFRPATARCTPDLVVVVADGVTEMHGLLPASVRTRAGVRHLVLSHGPVDDGLALSAVRAGADGVASLSLPDAAMLASLMALMRGEAVLPRSTVSSVLSAIRTRPGRVVHRDDGRPVELSEREWQVLELLAVGCTTAEVSRRMTIGEATVRGYLRTAVTRLRASDRADAVRIFRGDALRPASRDDALGDDSSVA